MYVCLCTYVSVHACMHAWMCKCLCMSVCLHVSVHVCLGMSMHAVKLKTFLKSDSLWIVYIYQPFGILQKTLIKYSNHF